MANSQNGWPIIPDNDAGRKHLTSLKMPGTMPHPVRVLSGDVATIAQWHVDQYRKRVEPLKPPGCWGWNVRKIGSGNDWSNHSSATAWDLNAPDNPDGARPSEVMTAAQIAECHKLEQESDNVLRWGGDWSDPDPMHWEIIKGATAVAAFAKKIRKENPVAENPRTWDNPVVLALNFLLYEAARASRGQATGTTNADKNARNVRSYFNDIIDNATTAPKVEK